MINGIRFAPVQVIFLKDGDHVGVLGVDHHGDPRLLRQHHGLEDGLVVRVEARALVGHEELEGGDPDLGKAFDLVEYGVLGIHDDAVESVVHASDVLGLGGLSADGLQQGNVLVLRGEVHDGRGAAHRGGVRRLEEATSKGPVVNVLVHPTREDVFPGGVDGLVRLHVQFAPYLLELAVLDVDIALELVVGGDDRAVLYQEAHAFHLLFVRSPAVV